MEATTTETKQRFTSLVHSCLKPSGNDREGVVDDEIQYSSEQQRRDDVIEALTAEDLHITHQLRQGDDDGQ